MSNKLEEKKYKCIIDQIIKFETRRNEKYVIMKKEK